MGYNDRGYYRPMGFGGFSVFPPVIKNILIINAVVFLITLMGRSIIVGNTLLDNWIVLYFGLIPIGIPLVDFYPWQLITYQFLHADFWHIFFNMLMLWMFGMELENMWGSKKFLIYYLLCGIGGGLLQLTSPSAGPTIGASGAVFGIMVAFAMSFPDRYIYIYFLIPVKAKYLIGFLIVFEFLSVGNTTMSFVAHLAHLGGAITGFIFFIIDKRKTINLKGIFSSLKKPSQSQHEFRGRQQTYRSPFSKGKDVQDADFYDIRDSKKEELKVDQEEIDRILDKISQSGYQNLTEREKKVLFEASKKS
ncbi:MAG: rhomboid family intramembrane serine protease [bacterium]